MNPKGRTFVARASSGREGEERSEDRSISLRKERSRLGWGEESPARNGVQKNCEQKN